MSLTISAVIPVYNGEKFLRNAVSTILKQSSAVDEIVIIDDGSKDSTLEIANSLSHSSVVPINVYHQENGGVSSARNLGVIKSKSDLVAFLDTDDIWHKDKIKKIREQYNIIGDDEAFIFTDYYRDGERDETRKSLDSKNIKIFNKKIVSKSEFQINFVEENFVGTASVMVFNRDLALKIGAFDIRLNYSEDFDFILRYSKYAPIHFLNEPLTTKNEHDENLSQNRELYLWSHWASLKMNILMNERYCRNRYDEEVLNRLKKSADDFLLLYCNEVYEKSAKTGLALYYKSLFNTYSLNGFQFIVFSIIKKTIRTLSFGLIKRKK